MIRDRRGRREPYPAPAGVCGEPPGSRAEGDGAGAAGGREGWLLPWEGALRRVGPPEGAERLVVAGGEAPLFLLRRAGGGPGAGWWVAARPGGPWRSFPAPAETACGSPGAGVAGLVDAAAVAVQRAGQPSAALLLLREAGRLEVRLPPAWEVTAELDLAGAGLEAQGLLLEAAGVADELLFLLRAPSSAGSAPAPRPPLHLGGLALDGELRLPLRPLEGFDPERSGLVPCGTRAYLALARPGEPVEVRARASGPWPRSAWGPGALLPGSERLPRGRLAVVRRRWPGGGEELLAVWRAPAGTLAWRFAAEEGAWELRPVDSATAGPWLRIAPPLTGYAGWEGGWLPRALLDPIQELPIVVPSGPG
ncbi:MAG: hypothetical protein QJR08_05015 [Bacillota bacterium]|nr:hypothetical protein [Bacillota bacterium]